MKKRVGLIGLGQIAAGYGQPDERAPYCHAGGLMHSEKVKLVAVADPSTKAQSDFQNKWGAALEAHGGFPAVYSDASEMIRCENLDIVGFCVRGPLHFAVLRPLLDLPEFPPALFLEKPPFCSLAECDEVIALARARGITITVSYSRHWAPHVLHLRDLVRDGLIGEVQSVVAYCGGPVLSFASHTTDLVCQFACAQAEEYSPLWLHATGAVGENRPPVPPAYAERGFETEPSLHSLFVRFANGVTGLQIGRKSDHDQFYADAFGSKGRVRVGIYTPPMAFDADNAPIDLAEFNFPRDASVFERAYDQIADFQNGGPPPHCSERDWQMVNEIGFGAIESFESGQIVTLPNTRRDRAIYADD